MKVKRPRRFGKFAVKAQTGAEASTGQTVQNEKNPKTHFDTGSFLTSLTPFVNQFVTAQNQNRLQKNTYQSSNPFYNQVNSSAFAQDTAMQQQQQQGQNQMAGNVLSTGMNMAMPGLGLVVPLTDFVGNNVSNAKQKYGITYYDSNMNALASDLSLSKRVGDMVRKDKDEKWGEYAVNWATGGGYNMLTKTRQRNEANKNKIAQLENAEKQMAQLDRFQREGIYAKKGVKYGNYTMYQVQGMPRHNDNIVYDSVENKVYPAMEKGAGGVVINFAGNEKVLIENGEYVVRDKSGNPVAVLPEKIGKQVLSGKITVEEAFKKIPNVNDAETAKVAQDGAVDEDRTEQQEIQQQMPAPQNMFPPQQKSLSIRDLIYGSNPILSAIINQPPKNKTIAKKGLVNDDGYLHDSKNRNNPVNIIKSNVITTEGMAFPIYANGQLLMPDTGVYKFKQSYVVETPVKAEKAKCGVKHYGRYTSKAQDGLFQDMRYRFQKDYSTPDYEIPYTPDTSVTPKKFNFKLRNIDWTDPDIVNSNNPRDVNFWYDPDIAADNSQTKIEYDPDRPYDSFANEGSHFKTPMFSPYRKDKTPKDTPLGSTDYTFRPVDINTPAQYALGLINLYKAYTAKPSERGRYFYDPEVARSLAQNKYYEQQGDQQGYKEALRKIEAERMRAMQQATQTNTSAGTYMNTLASLAGNLSDAQQDAYSNFITKKQEEGRRNTQNFVATTHASERSKVFNDMLADYKEKQDFANAREQRISNSMKYLTDALQNRREAGISQYNQYLNYIGKANENLIEYYLLYGIPEQKRYAQTLLENPSQIYPRIQNKWGAMNYGTYTPQYKKTVK